MWNCLVFRQTLTESESELKSRLRLRLSLRVVKEAEGVAGDWIKRLSSLEGNPPKGLRVLWEQQFGICLDGFDCTQAAQAVFGTGD